MTGDYIDFSDPNVQNPSVPPAAAAQGGAPGLSFAQGMSDFGMGLSYGGTAGSAIGSFYAIRSQQHETKSRALSQKHLETMSRINARAAEVEAREIELAGRKTLQLSQLANQQEHGTLVARQGSRGIRLDSGSALEERVSLQLAQEIDEMTITRNTVAAAGQARLRAVGLRNRAGLARVSANNLRRTAGSMSAVTAGTTNLLSGLGGIGRQLANDRRFR
jgi:hypothetical protein